MIREGLSVFKGKRILLLQGPLGPFFWRLAKDLRRAGAIVTKVNFNGGDWLFYPTGAVAFRGNAEEWPAFLERLLVERGIDTVMLFGDCRAMHQMAHAICVRRGLDLGVFEEGYIRPDYITLERWGVNANSRMPREPDFYHDISDPAPAPAIKIGHTFWHGALWAVLYYTVSNLLRPLFREYRHHRPLAMSEGWSWMRSFWRKARYAEKEKGIASRLGNSFADKYFLVPLQVHNDSQIHTHSNFKSVEDFIQTLIHSFALAAPSDTLLVIKHHPMDRGYHDYSSLIETLARWNRIENRVLYIHDQHLPTLLSNARGVIVVNSTVGISALHHEKPVKVCGNALYDIKGLTYQGSLEEFWTDAQHAEVDEKLFRRFQACLVERTQINGSFYKRLGLPGVDWCVGWTLGARPARKEQSREQFSTNRLRFPISDLK